MDCALPPGGVSANPPEPQLPMERMPSPNLAWVLGDGLPILPEPLQADLPPSATPATRVTGEFYTWLLPRHFSEQRRRHLRYLISLPRCSLAHSAWHLHTLTP